MQEDDRPGGGDRRRVPARLLAHGLHLPARRRREAGVGARGRVPQPGGSIVFTPPSMRVDGRSARSHDLRRGLRVPARDVTTAMPKLTIPSPSMVHYRGGRSAIDETRLPRPRRVLGRSHSGLSRGGGRLGELGCTYLQLDDTSLAYLNDPSSARTWRRSAATRSTSTRPTSATSTRRSRPARGHGDHDAHVPRQLPLVVVRLGRLRVRRRGAAQRARGGRLLHGVGRRALGRLRAAAVPAAGQARRARPRDHEERRARAARTRSSAGSRRRRRFADIDQLCLSPQCGFSSTVDGNDLTSSSRPPSSAWSSRRAREVWG